MKVNHYALQGLVAGNPGPQLLFQVKVDLQHVRSAYRYSDTFLLVAEWLAADSVWTPDMVHRIAPDRLVPIDPPSPSEPPADADGRMLSFLMRHLRFQLWRNDYLKVYSNPGESRDDFLSRCRELLLDGRTQEMRGIRELWLHRFSELETKARQYLDSEEMDRSLKVNLAAQTGEVFARIREDLNRTFGEESCLPVQAADLKWDLNFCPDVHDRLQDLGRDMIQAYNDVCMQFKEMASDIEAYEITLGRSDLDVMIKGLVWSLAG